MLSSPFTSNLCFCFFFLIIRPPPRSTLFPYTTLSRSGWEQEKRSRLRHPRPVYEAETPAAGPGVARLPGGRPGPGRQPIGGLRQVMASCSCGGGFGKPARWQRPARPIHFRAAHGTQGKVSGDGPAQQRRSEERRVGKSVDLGGRR